MRGSNDPLARGCEAAADSVRESAVAFAFIENSTQLAARPRVA